MRRESSLKKQKRNPLRPGYSCYCRYGHVDVKTNPPPSFNHPPPPPPFLFFHIWDFPTFLPKRLLNWYGRYTLVYIGWFSPTLFRFSFELLHSFTSAAGQRHVRPAKFSAVIWPGFFSFQFCNLKKNLGRDQKENMWQTNPFVIKSNELYLKMISPIRKNQWWYYL